MKRDNSHEVRDGVLLDITEDAVHLSTGVAAPTFQANFGDRFFSTNGIAYKNVSNPSPGNTWQITSQAGGTGSQIKDYSFDDNTQPDISTSSMTYKKLAAFIFRGSNQVGIPTKIFAGMFKTGSPNGKFSIKIFDATNGNTIVEKTLNTNEDEDDIIDLGALANIPTDRSSFEIQMKVIDGAIAHLVALDFEWA